jgi:signal transduction histidine kinase
MERVNLSLYLSKYFSDTTYNFENKAVHIVKNYEENSTLYVKIDKSAMGRVLMNIMENSYKYRKGDDVTIQVGLEKSGTNAVLTFSDNGKGVDSVSLGKIFDRFYREDESRTSRIKGNGLGLAIVKEIVQSFGGSITCESFNGLSLMITLPLVGTGANA